MIAALHNPDIEQTRSEPHSGHATQFGDPCVQLRIGETDVDFAVELFDDCDRRVLWHADPIPNARLIAWHELGYGRYGRRASERSAVVTASARSVPALIYPIDDGMDSNVTCTCPRDQIAERG